MKILVCIKQILDPEVPASDFKIDPATRKAAQGKAKLVMDSYSEYALEVALQFKEKNPGTTVSAVCVGPKSADEVLRKALALLADEAVRVWEEGWDNLDAHALSRVLALTANKLGGVDLVLVGRQSGDEERGLVAPMLSEELGAECVTVASQVERAADDAVRVRREAAGGFVTLESRLPVVVSITNDDANVLRLPKVKDVMMASRKPITVLGAADLGVEQEALAPRLVLQAIYVPELKGACEIVEGDAGEEKGVNLARRLREIKVV